MRGHEGHVLSPVDERADGTVVYECVDCLDPQRVESGDKLGIHGGECRAHDDPDECICSGADDDDDLHPWVRLCDLAMCSPDFDVVYRYDREEACVWLANWLRDHDHSVSGHDIRAAYDSWPPKPADRTAVGS